MSQSRRASESERTDVQRVSAGETAEGYVEALISQGVEYLFLNPGTDTFPVQEALKKLSDLGRPVPKTVLCLFEIVALSAAHGYYAATGRPQAVMVHVDVGTQNLGSMLHDAQRGHGAVVIAAGRAPYTDDPNLRGSRSSYIHWLQEQLDQHGIVRNYVKWDYELRRPDQVGEAVARAFQIAASDPPGPTYLTLPREILMHGVGETTLKRADRFPPSKFGSGDIEALRMTARKLVASERPVILCENSGRTEAGFKNLVELAELLAIPVVEWRNRANFPADHPMHLGYDDKPFVAEADVILALDHDYPYIPTHTHPDPDATIIQIDIDPVKEKIPLWSFPIDLPIRASAGDALPFITEIATEMLTQDDRDRIEARRQRLTQMHMEQRSDWHDAAQRDRDVSPMTARWIGHCLGELYKESPECIFIDETVTNNVSMWQQIPVSEYSSWFCSGGSGLGWGLGAGLGVSLARPGRPVVSIVGDGSFVFGAPTAALWAMQVNKAPVMVVILNNTCYNATKRPLVANYPEGYSVRNDQFVGVDLMPPPRYDLLAQVVGAYGERVEEPDAALPALRRGLEKLRTGQSVVLDMILAHP